MEKFSKLRYTRPDLEEAQKYYRDAAERIRNAADYSELREAILSMEETQKHIGTMYSLAHIRNTIDMTDAFYEAEIAYFNENMPRCALAGKLATEAYLDSPFRKDFEEEFGTQYTKLAEADILTQSDAIIDEKVRDSKLQNEYSKLTATATTDFRGESLNFYGLLKHMQDTDRETRKEAFLKWADLYESISPKLDSIYDEMVSLRLKEAEKLGMKVFLLTDCLINKKEYNISCYPQGNFTDLLNYIDSI